MTGINFRLSENKNKMKKIYGLILANAAFFNINAADTDWKVYLPFDEKVNHVIETPEYVYFTSLQLSEEARSDVFSSLFRYDKKGDELVPLSTSNILNGNSVRDLVYNPSKGYVMVLYKNYDIDFLYNNGKVVNLPYYEQSSLSYSKKVNSLNADQRNDRVYMATDFGYIALNDKKNEVAESRIYGEPLQSFTRIGNTYFAIKDDELIKADVTAPRLSLDQYETVETFDSPLALYPVGTNAGILVGGEGASTYFVVLDAEGNKIQTTQSGPIYNVENNKDGLTLAAGIILYQVNENGEVKLIEKPAAYRNMAASTYNGTEMWNGQMRKGLTGLKKSGESWNVAKDWMLPDSPNAYVSISFVNHPSKGLLMVNNGYMPSTMSVYNNSPLQINGLQQGRWNNYAPAYTNPSRTNVLTGPNGIAIDPDNSSYVYVTSYHSNFARINLNNPQDIIHFTDVGDPDRNNPGFVELPGKPNHRFANMGAPNFDNRGNMWINWHNTDNSSDGKLYFYCWTAEDRKATISASNARPPQMVVYGDNLERSNNSISLPLKKSNGMIVFARSQYDDQIVLIDTNNTPTDTSDDKIYKFPNFSDSDGSPIELRYVKWLWEDPSTGYVWICHSNGVCYFSPSQVKQGNFALNRVKVSRNDGTNLADYLLEGVTVNQVASDSDGRKWFVTGGAGVVCTSSDGREIYEEFTTANSPLPDDVVFGVGYNTENNSLLFSTAQGYAEYKVPGSGGTGSDKEDVRAYPNPVRPEYSGYVTITDVPQGSFVKITDVHGNLVKDLGIMTGFEMLWDISDSNFNRVKSGVYHIMISPSDESSSYSAVGKILVVS